ncbi:flagellar basal body protein, partial [Clostridioides difficile]
CEITDEVFDEVISEIKKDMTELEVSALIQYHALKKGASGMSFGIYKKGGHNVIRGLYTAVSAMITNQQKQNVVVNNLANMDTNG